MFIKVELKDYIKLPIQIGMYNETVIVSLFDIETVIIGIYASTDDFSTNKR